jgi:tetratricopeptide (TPR) repeat protein
MFTLQLMERSEDMKSQLAVLGLFFVVIICSTGCGDSKTQLASKAYEDGLKHCQQGDYQEGIDAFTKAIEYDPKDYEAYINRGSAYDMLNQYDKALADYSVVISSLAPNDKRLAEVYYNRGYMYQRRGERTKAIADYKQALRLNPKLPDAREHLGELGVR